MPQVPPEAVALPPVKRSLRFKLMGFAALVALLGGGLPAGYLVLRARGAERARIGAQLKQLGSTIAGGGLFADGSGGIDPAALAAFVDNAPSLRLPLAYVVVVDEEGRVDTGASALSPVVLREIDPALADVWIAGGHAQVLEQLAAGSAKVNVHQSLAVKLKTPSGEVLGQLRIGMSTLEADRRARVALLQSAGLVGGLMILALGMAIFLSGRLAGPIRRVADAMGRVAEGDLEQGVPPLETRDEVGRLAAAFNVMVAGLKQRERLRSTLGRYVSDEIAEHLLGGKEGEADLSGETRQVTVLFLDMRDFSSTSEREDPHVIFTLLNAYFEIIVDAVNRHHGVINKFIGDAIMAVWGAPRAVPDPELNAVRTAWEIQQRIGALNWQRHQDGKLVVNVGIGINTGLAVAGNVGAESRMEYTVIGHTVNMAQRFESAAGPGQILISPQTHSQLGDRVQTRALPPTRVKGRSEPIILHEILDVPSAPERSPS
ncbi:MAG: adenylate/guanylate cyclase domain-containing protein [Deltaproteobacteria bacterium]|nr:adenylate/guanylate cyclase domain-containing protein [Deltaproteobacteria bacterium]